MHAYLHTYGDGSDENSANISIPYNIFSNISGIKYINIYIYEMIKK